AGADSSGARPTIVRSRILIDTAQPGSQVREVGIFRDHFIDRPWNCPCNVELLRMCNFDRTIAGYRQYVSPPSTQQTASLPTRDATRCDSAAGTISLYRNATLSIARNILVAGVVGRTGFLRAMFAVHRCHEARS